MPLCFQFSLIFIRGFGHDGGNASRLPGPHAALIDSEPEAYGTSHRRRRGLLTARRKVLHWAARRPGALFCALMSSSPSAYFAQRFSRCCQEWRPSIAPRQFSRPTQQWVGSNLWVPLPNRKLKRPQSALILGLRLFSFHYYTRRAIKLPRFHGAET